MESAIGGEILFSKSCTGVVIDHLWIKIILLLSTRKQRLREQSIHNIEQAL